MGSRSSAVYVEEGSVGVISLHLFDCRRGSAPRIKTSFVVFPVTMEELKCQALHHSSFFFILHIPVPRVQPHIDQQPDMDLDGLSGVEDARSTRG